MKTHKTILTGVLATAILAIPTLAAITNGGFEVAGSDPADAANWNEIEVAGGTLGALASVDRSAVNPLNGDWAVDFSVVGAPDFGPVAEIQQQTTVGSILGGSSYDFSFFAMGNPGPGTVAFYEVLWFDGDGSDGGGPQGSATGLQTFALNPAYAETSAPGLIAPATADSVLIQIRMVTGAFDGAMGSMSIDDVSMVPEPASLALLALGGLALIRRR